MSRRRDPSRAVEDLRRRIASGRAARPDRPARSLELRALDPAMLATGKALGCYEPDARAYTLGECSIIVGTDPATGRQHLSIAHPSRLPTWPEIVEARARLLAPNAVFAQILPPSRGGSYVNLHRHCLHLWELPPGIGSQWADAAGDRP